MTEAAPKNRVEEEVRKASNINSLGLYINVDIYAPHTYEHVNTIHIKGKRKKR